MGAEHQSNPPTDPTTSKWICPLCTDAHKVGENDNTPVKYDPNVSVRPRKKPALNSPPGDKPVTRDEMEDIIQGFMVEVNKSIRKTIGDILSTELKSIRGELNEVKESMDFINDKFEAITQENSDSSMKIKRLEEENSSLQSTIQDLSTRINHLEQSARNNNIEIQCVPEKRDENLLNIVKNLGNTINFQITEDYLAHLTRVAKLNKDSNRPRSIIVQFNSPRVRDQFLAASIKYNKYHPQDRLNSSHAGISGAKTPIFVCEHLSTANKTLHAAARQVAKDKGYKYVWVRGGRIYMRKTETSEFKIIKNTDSLNKLP